MWPFSKKQPPPAPPPKPPMRYSVTELQVGDEAVCVADDPHTETHQKLLVCGTVYKVRAVCLGAGEGGYGGPFIKVEGVIPVGDGAWACTRFRKVIKKKTAILTQVMEPVDLDVELEKKLAPQL